MSFYFNSVSLITCTQHMVFNVVRYTQDVISTSCRSQYVDAYDAWLDTEQFW